MSDDDFITTGSTRNCSSRFPDSYDINMAKAISRSLTLKRRDGRRDRVLSRNNTCLILPPEEAISFIAERASSIIHSSYNDDYEKHIPNKVETGKLTAIERNPLWSLARSAPELGD